jgi:serine/threonine-protein kinase
MSTDTLVEDLLDRWEERRRLRQTITVEDLREWCAGRPDVLAELQRRIGVLEQFDRGRDGRLSPPAATASLTPAATLAPGDPAATADAPAAAIPLPRIPNFEILGELGRGGMGVVFRARQVALNREVALKMILAGGFARAEDRSRFLSEAQSVAALQHPGVVQVYEMGTHEDLPYLALEYCSGGNLVTKLAGTPLPPAEAADLVEQLARTMQVVHAAGIVHRDLKPANVLLVAGQTPKVTDFGLVKRIEGGEQVTQSGAIVGTPSYMAPEQAKGSKEVGPPADIYALGAILYECLTGRPPFRAPTPLDTVLQVISAEPVSVRRLNPVVPTDLETICHKCLQKDPGRRYESAAALADDLGRWRRGEPIAARPIGLAERGWRWCRRNWAIAASMAVVLVLVLTGFVGGSVGLVVLDKARRTAEGERDKAQAARYRTREALDAMVSGVTGDSLAAQQALTPEQRKFLESVLKYYEEFAAEPGEDREGRERLASAHGRLAAIRDRLGQKAEAEAVYRRAAALYEGLAHDFPTAPVYRRQLGEMWNGLGAPLHFLGKRAEAEAAYRAAVATFTRLAAEFPDVPDYKNQLAKSRCNVGYLLQTLQRSGESKLLYIQAVKAQEELVAQFPDVAEFRRDLGDSYHCLGTLGGDDRGAEAVLKAALAVQKKLSADFPDVPAYRRDLARSYDTLGLTLRSARRLAEAETAYRSALGLRDKLATDFPATPDYRRELARTHRNVAVLLSDQGKFAEAESEHRAALAIFERLAVDFPAIPSYRRGVGISQDYLGILFTSVGRLDVAEEAYRAAVAICEQLTRDFPTAADYRLDLARCQTQLGRLLARRGEADKAAPVLRSAIELFTRLSGEFPTFTGYREELGRNCHDLGLLLSTKGNLSEAQATFRTAVVVREKLAADFPAMHDYAVQLGTTYCDFGRLVRDGGDAAAALEWHGKAIARVAPVVAGKPSLVWARQVLRDGHWNRAKDLVQLQRFADAVADWDEAMRLDDGSGRLYLRLGRADCLARLCRPAEASREASEVAANPAASASDVYDCACVLSLGTGDPGNTAGEAHAAQAVALLRQSIIKGFADIAHLLADPDLAPLGKRDDYADLLWCLADA